MPRLKGYRERVNANVWDACSFEDLREVSVINLFGNRNIGDTVMTNMMIAGQIASDATLVILNWYARTNLVVPAPAPAPPACEMLLPDGTWATPPAPATLFAQCWHAFINSAIVTLAVGTRPVMQRPLSDLVGPRDMHGGIGGQDQFEEVSSHERMAMQLYRAYSSAQVAANKSPFPEGGRSSGMETWLDLSEAQRRGWKDAATAIRPTYRPIIVPVRQYFSVQISTNIEATRALLACMPRYVAPKPLLWIHLDGLQTRDVA